MSPEKSLPECLGSIFDCQSQVPTCHNSARFDFPTLWTITSQYAQQCPGGPWLFKTGPDNSSSASQLAFTDEVCKAIAGPGYKVYPTADIWSRLTQWKFPLFQLIANSPRAPLGFWVEVFTLVHFCGDPIGTIQDVLRKIDGTQSRARFWQDCLNKQLVLLEDDCSEPEQRCLWKSLTLIVDSFDEWGQEVADQAQDYLLIELTKVCLPTVDRSRRQRYLDVCLRTADALAADRSTRSLPIVVAQAFFIGSVVIAMIRTTSASESPTSSTYVNVEIYSIAFTAQYFWVIFAVIWKSMIGVSQTAAALPRILEKFRGDLEKEVAPHGSTVNLPIERLDPDLRIRSGGIYSWQPARWNRSSGRGSEHDDRTTQTSSRSVCITHRCIRVLSTDLWTVVRAVVPVLMVLVAAATGQLICAMVPPEGWSCRSSAMLYMSLTWLASYTIRWVPFFGKYKLQFWVTLVKDTIATGLTMGFVIWVQFGAFNKCGCYTLDGRVGLQLPFMPAVRDRLQARLSSTYPAVVACGILFQLILVPGLMFWRYHAAIQVFLQRDDGTSNLDWWYEFEQWIRIKWSAVIRRKGTVQRAGRVSAVGKSIGVLPTSRSASTQRSDKMIESCACCRSV